MKSSVQNSLKYLISDVALFEHAYRYAHTRGPTLQGLNY